MTKINNISIAAKSSLSLSLHIETIVLKRSYFHPTIRTFTFPLLSFELLRIPASLLDKLIMRTFFHYFPSSITRIQSACCTADKRCVVIIVVFPLLSVLIFSMIAASVRASTADKESSKIKISGF